MVEVPAPTSTILYRPTQPASNVVIQEELVGMRPQRDRIDLLGPLVGQPRLDYVLGEHAPLEQEVVVRFERGQRFRQRARRVLDVLALFRLELVQIHVHRLWRVSLALYTGPAPPEERGEREGPLSPRIGRPGRGPLRLRRPRGHRCAGDSLPASPGIEEVEW